MTNSTSIPVPDNQKKLWDEHLEMIQQIENVMKAPLNHNDIDSLAMALSKAITLLAMNSRIMEIATGFHDNAIGRATAIFREEEDMKQEIARKWFTGQLAIYSARYERADRCVKSLTTYIDGLRTLISTEKEQLKNIQS